METFKLFDEICKIDERHILMGQVTGEMLSLENLHLALSEIKLNDSAPDVIQGQFNVAKNMALYTYFSYSLAPEVHMKAYSVMEMALRIFYGGNDKTNLKSLVRKAVDSGHINDSGFRHVADDPDNSYSKKFIDVYPSLRNSMAHGSSMLTPDCLGHIEKCANFINQLYPVKSHEV